MSLSFAAADPSAIPLYITENAALEGFLAGLPASHRAELEGRGFTAALGQCMALYGPKGDLEMAVLGYGTPDTRARGRFHVAAAVSTLPMATYRLVHDLPPEAVDEAGLGWLLAGYQFDRYHKCGGARARLCCPEGVDSARIEIIARGEALTRDLINTPASDMGPEQLEEAFVGLADEFGAKVKIIAGEALIERNLPMIHAVGRASDRAPRLLDMRWGDDGPKLTLVGKGVCFDTGGLNIKPGASMGLMKKDMGGAATVMGLARMIMALKLKLRLRVLVPAVENAISGPAMRPGDILTSRKGLTVEINNTDAEGRLVLADALTLASEETSDLVISMATLTGAARVAVGPDLAPYFTNDDSLAATLETAARQVRDPVWRLPFWEPYEQMIEPGIADLDNAPKGGFAGSITAALFLRRFVGDADLYAHFDIYGWQPTAAPARPKGGVGQGARAILAALPDALGL